MADYQVRGWLAWHYHMALVMMAMLFMLKERLLHKESYPMTSTGVTAAVTVVPLAWSSAGFLW